MYTVNVFTRHGNTVLNTRPLFSLQGNKALFHRHFTCELFQREAISQKSKKRGKNNGKLSKTRTLERIQLPSDDYLDLSDRNSKEDDNSSNNSTESLNGDLHVNESVASPTRVVVLQACFITSGLLLALGTIIRQASRIASTEGWAIFNSAKEVSFGFEMWHVELILGLVGLISSSRYILLKSWPDFLESSEAANKQTLSSLQPLDYVVVAFLPGISEELLFRGALLPLFGLNWKSALMIGAIFGILHLGSSRRYSYVVWATFVGFVYGLATIFSSSVIVPMVSHSLNNIIGGLLWRFTSSPQEKIK